MLFALQRSRHQKFPDPPVCRCTTSCLSTASTWPPRHAVMQQDLGLSNFALGLAFSAFNYSYAPFQLVGGWFADRFGARRTLTVCGLAWSVTTIATGAVTGLASLFARASRARHGRGCDVAGGDPCGLEMDPASRSAAPRSGLTHAAGRLGAANGGADRRLSDHLVLLAFFIRRGRHRVDFLGGRVVAGISTRIRASTRASPAPSSPHCRPLITRPWLGSGPVPWRRLIPARGAVDDRLFLPGLDRLAVCDLDAVLVAEKLWCSRSRNRRSFTSARVLAAILAELIGGMTTD